MRKFIASVIVLLSMAIPSVASSAIKIDRNAITASVADKGAYKALTDRFASGQKLDTPEMAALYYGAALQPGFKAAQTYPEIQKAYAAGDYAATLSLVQKALEKDPVNLSLLFTGYGAAVSLKNQEAAQLMQNRLLQVCDLIFASGAGVSQDSPYLVVRPSDMDEFLTKYIQPTQVKSRARIANLDAVMVAIDGVPDDVIMYFQQF